MNCFSPGSIIHDLQSTEKFDAIEEIVTKASVFSGLPDSEPFLKDIFQRELRQNTGFGHGVAVAHGICETNSVAIALGISHRGIEYGSPDGKPVHLLFIIASPKSHCDSYLCSLSALVKLLRKSRFRENLLNTDTVIQAEDLLFQSFSKQLAKE